MKIYENILKGRVKYPPYIHPDAQDLLQRLITSDLTKRLGNTHGGAEGVKNHQWFAEVTWERLAKKDIDAPYVPPVKAGVGDASQFDKYPEETESYGQLGHDEYVQRLPRDEFITDIPQTWETLPRLLDTPIRTLLIQHSLLPPRKSLDLRIYSYCRVSLFYESHGPATKMMVYSDTGRASGRYCHWITYVLGMDRSVGFALWMRLALITLATVCWPRNRETSASIWRTFGMSSLRWSWPIAASPRSMKSLDMVRIRYEIATTSSSSALTILLKVRSHDFQALLIANTSMQGLSLRDASLDAWSSNSRKILPHSRFQVEFLSSRPHDIRISSQKIECYIQRLIQS